MTVRVKKLPFCVLHSKTYRAAGVSHLSIQIYRSRREYRITEGDMLHFVI